MKYSIYLIAIIALFSCKNNNNKSFVVKGKITNSTNNKVYLMEVPFGAKQPVMLDSTILSANNEFELKAFSKEENMYVVTNSNADILLVNDAPLIKINTDINNFKHYAIEGSEATKFLHQFLYQYDSLNNILKKTFVEIDSSENKKYSEAITDSLENEKDNQLENINKLLQENISKATNATAACYLSTLTFRTMELADIKQTVDNVLARMKDKNITKLKKIIDEQIKANPKQAMLYQQAPEINMQDTAGNNVTLSSFKGKWVLVDFWASWCPPCRRENPNVVKAFNTFKNKNFTVLSISLDSTKAAWLKAINHDSLTWNHISDYKQWESKTVKTYGVESIPSNFLINPSGQIIAMDLRDKKLMNKLAEVLK